MSSSGPPKHLIMTGPARAAVRDIQQCLDARLKRKGCTGITTWIKNTARAGVPFSVNRTQSARGTEGLSIGRVTDGMLRKYCNGDPIPGGYARSHFDHAARALAREKLMPVAAQLACALGPLKTEVDAICLREGANGRVGIVVVELKTSRQSLAQHAASYAKPCLRKPYMDVAGLKNSEEAAHQLQADFGLKALRQTYPQLARYYMESIVLYATKTGARVYPVTPFPKTTFDVVGAPAHAVVDPGKNEFPMLPTAPAGGTMIRDVLKRAGHTKIAAGGTASCTSTDRENRECVVGISPGWHRLTKQKQRGLTKVLRRKAGKKQPWLVCRNKDRQWVAAPLRDT